MALTRPLKEGSVTTYQQKVSLGFKDILASEADADHDTMYAAWNGALGGDLTGTLPNPTVVAAAKSKWTVSGATLTPTDATKTVTVLPTAANADVLVAQGSGNTPKLHLSVMSTQGFGLRSNHSNASGALLDDTTKPAWSVQVDNTDSFRVYRAPATAGTPAYNALLTLDNAGSLTNANTLTVSGANLTVGSAGSPRVTLGQRCALEAWDGNIVTLYANDASTVGYNSAVPGWKLGFDYRAPGTFYLQYRPAAGAFANAFYIDASSNLVIAGPTGQKSTGTTWANPSDPRLKQDVASYAAGLAEIAQLKPITYRLKAQPDLLCYGFDAEKVRAVFPECVTETRMKLDPADEEETDGVLTFDMHPILVALINAVKELAEKVP